MDTILFLIFFNKFGCYESEPSRFSSLILFSHDKRRFSLCFDGGGLPLNVLFFFVSKRSDPFVDIRFLQWSHFLCCHLSALISAVPISRKRSRRKSFYILVRHDQIFDRAREACTLCWADKNTTKFFDIIICNNFLKMTNKRPSKKGIYKRKNNRNEGESGGKHTSSLFTSLGMDILWFIMSYLTMCQLDNFLQIDRRMYEKRNVWRRRYMFSFLIKDPVMTEILKRAIEEEERESEEELGEELMSRMKEQRFLYISKVHMSDSIPTHFLIDKIWSLLHLSNEQFFSFNMIPPFHDMESDISMKDAKSCWEDHRLMLTHIMIYTKEDPDPIICGIDLPPHIGYGCRFTKKYIPMDYLHFEDKDDFTLDHKRVTQTMCKYVTQANLHCHKKAEWVTLVFSSRSNIENLHKTKRRDSVGLLFPGNDKFTNSNVFYLTIPPKSIWSYCLYGKQPGHQNDAIPLNCAMKGTTGSKNSHLIFRLTRWIDPSVTVVNPTFPSDFKKFNLLTDKEVLDRDSIVKRSMGDTSKFSPQTHNMILLPARPGLKPQKNVFCK